MSLTPLTGEEIQGLSELILTGLEREPVVHPAQGLGGELSYTAEWVRPLIEKLVASLDHTGLLTAGDGGRSVRPLPLMGMLFAPDVTVSYYDQPVLALEVKLVRTGAGQSTITRALGQALVYRDCGFPMSAVLALNAGGLKAAPERQVVGGVPILVREVPYDAPTTREEED